MKDFLILKVLDRFQFIFTKLGVNYKNMRTILNVKLIIDERRVPTVMYNEEGKEGNYFTKSLLLYGLMGIFLLIFIITPYPLFFKMNLIYGILLFMIISTLISDFSSVLLDVNEKNILLPKPVDSKSINLAKTIHVLIYLLTISLVISGPTLIAGTMIYGLLFFGIFLFQLFFVLGFAIFLTSLLYFLILLFFNGEKLKGIINYFQIGFTIAIAVIYQFVGRAFGIIDFDVLYTPTWWSYLLPPAWFSAPYSLIINKEYNPVYIWLTVIGIVVSMALLAIYLKLIAPYFEKNLSKLNDNSTIVKIDVKKRARRKARIAQLFTSNKLERIFYVFTQRMIGGEGKLKLRIFPGLAFSVIFPLIFLFNNLGPGQSLDTYLESMRGSNYFLIFYVSLLMLISVTPVITSSERYNAAWIYGVAPIESDAYIYKGSTKALLINYLLPPFVLTSIIFVFVFGLGTIPDVLVIFLNLILLMIYIFRVSEKQLPFSQDYKSIKDKSTKVFFHGAFFSVISILIHFLFSRLGYGVYIYIAIQTLAIKFLWNRVFK